VTGFANEPVLHAQLLQRSAMTYKMSNGQDYVEAAKEVGASGGIDLMALFGLDKTNTESVQKLADLSFNKRRGIEYFGQQQQHLTTNDAGAGDGGSSSATLARPRILPPAPPVFATPLKINPPTPTTPP